jgi:1-acyl-sn-glycerol-3-phosphate acyltransferase
LTPQPPQPDWTYTPARDHGLGEVARLKSTSREPGLVSTTAHSLACHALSACLRGYHRLRVEGRQHVPAKPPFVVIANHASHLDALVLAAALPRRVRACTYPISAGDVFFESLATSALTSMFINALPLWRKKVTRHALEDLRARLLAGDSAYILFPEGARSRDGHPLPFKPGVGHLVAGTPVPVVPCHIEGAFRAFPPGSKLPRPQRLRVRIGEPIVFEGTANERAGWAGVAAQLRAAVADLGGWPPETPAPE